MSRTRTSRIPAPLYAAAGAGELAYQQLRKLPTVVTNLRGKAGAGDLDRVREAAIRNAAVVVANAQAAQERAAAAYAALVARGERVVGPGVVRAETVDTDIETTDTVVPTDAVEVTEVVVTDAAEATGTEATDAAKPVAKHTRPTSRRTGPPTR